MHKQIRDIMTPNVFTIKESQSIQEAGALMSGKNIGSVPVVGDNGQIVGMITDRDITLRSTAQGEDAHTPVSEVMTAQEIVKATPDMDVHQAAEIMAQQQIRRLPVIDNGQVVGMIALGDLAVENQLTNESEEALSSISTPSEPQE